MLNFVIGKFVKVWVDLTIWSMKKLGILAKYDQLQKDNITLATTSEIFVRTTEIILEHRRKNKSKVHEWPVTPQHEHPFMRGTRHGYDECWQFLHEQWIEDLEFILISTNLDVGQNNRGEPIELPASSLDN